MLSNNRLDMDLFINTLRVMLNLNYYTVEHVMSLEEYQVFKVNPWRWMITESTMRQMKVWKAMQERETRLV